MKTSFLSLALAMALALSACENGPTVDAVNSAEVSENRSVQYGLTSGDDLKAAAGAVAGGLAAVAPIISSQSSWQTKHDRIAVALEDVSPESKEYAEQFAAVEMLRRELLSDPNPEKAEAASSYVNMLAQHQSPEVAVVLEAVELYKSEWGDERTAALASGAADGARQYLNGAVPCDKCGTEREAPLSSGSGSKAEFLDSVKEAEVRLRSYATL